MQSRIFRHGVYNLGYLLTIRPGRPLVVIFSAVDAVPGRALTSYFGCHGALDASVLHILDNFGNHGCYYMRLAGDDGVAVAVTELIRRVMAECAVPLSRTWLCGTSKGASAALYHSLAMGGGNCLLGEPQILIGDFLFGDTDAAGLPGTESGRSILYTMTGRVDPADRAPLNAILPDMARAQFGRWSGQAVLHVGETTGYMWRHVRHLQAILSDHPEAERNFEIRIGDFTSHNDVAEVFKADLETRFARPKTAGPDAKVAGQIADKIVGQAPDMAPDPARATGAQTATAAGVAPAAPGKYFLGITRFSLFLPDNPAWVMTDRPEADYFRDLYDPARMRARLDIFIRAALPIYERMGAGFFYRHVVQYSHEMPGEYLAELQAAARRYPFLHLQGVDRAGKHDGGVDTLFAGQPDGSVAIFRVDDDDILAASFLEQLSPYVDRVHEGMVVSFGCGFAAQYRDGRFSEFRHLARRLSSVGQSYIVSWEKAGNRIAFPRIVGHDRVDEHYPTILDSRRPAFLYTYHDSQDTVAAKAVREQARSVHPALLKLTRPQSRSILETLLPSLAEEISADFGGGDAILEIPTAIRLGTEPVVLAAGLDVGGIYEVAYRLEQNGGMPSGRSVVFSILTENVAGGRISGGRTSEGPTFEGLMLSPSPKIGFFRYMQAQSPAVPASFGFVVPQGVRVKRVALVPWESREPGAVVSELRIVRR